MHKEAGTPPGQATPRGPVAKRWGYRASAGRGIRQRERRIVQALSRLPVYGHLLPVCPACRARRECRRSRVAKRLAIRRTSGDNRGRHAARILDAATTSSTAVVPSATSRLTTHSSTFRRDPEEEAEEVEEEEEEEEEDSQERVQRRSFGSNRPDPNRRRTTTACSAECESDDEECGELISTESEGCHGESRPDRVVLISRRILSRGLC
ncbi:hypothetical protein ALC62_10020 [Cyphomyrmex costatus]|uniref:Uncharacterized protein n=1 Tax=Cyphomyrmex costatus TaxID=456900 RepID=A0A151IEJ8_9HYME|nr:hypothetical protein ALC62_10020 [Cyphomyrmex costatus]